MTRKKIEFDAYDVRAESNGSYGNQIKVSIDVDLEDLLENITPQEFLMEKGIHEVAVAYAGDSAFLTELIDCVSDIDEVLDFIHIDIIKEYIEKNTPSPELSSKRLIVNRFDIIDLSD